MDIEFKIINVLKKLKIDIYNGKYEIDSLKRITLWYELENEFGIIIDDEDYWQAQDDTISSLLKLINGYVKK